MILYGAFFVISFYVWACTHFFSFIVIYTHLRCYITSVERKTLKDLVNQKKKDVIFSLMFYFCKKKIGLKRILICVLII